MAEKLCNLVKSDENMENWVVGVRRKIGTYKINNTVFNLYKVRIQMDGMSAGQDTFASMNGIMTSSDYVLSIDGMYIMAGTTTTQGGYFPLNARYDAGGANQVAVWYSSATNSLMYNNLSVATMSAFAEVTFISLT